MDLSLRDRMRSSDIWERLRVEAQSSGNWSGYLLDFSVGRSFGDAQLRGDPGADLGHAGKIISLDWMTTSVGTHNQARWKKPGLPMWVLAKAHMKPT